MAFKASFFPPFLSSLLLLAAVVHSNAEEPNVEQLLVSGLLPSSICSSSKVTGSEKSTIEIVDRDGPCSGKTSFSQKNHLAFLSRDSRRVASIQAKVTRALLTNNSVIVGSQISVPAKSGIDIGTANYVITVGFGTPSKTQTVIFDTGSDVNWIQCKPCLKGCYSQLEPLFDPKLSSTYRNISCSSPTCLRLPSRGCYANRTCGYEVLYGDGSFTSGFLGSDTFNLTSTNVFSNFVFGCGQDNDGLFKGSAGLMGLGRSSYSLNSQLASKLGNVFTYCLPSTGSATGYLNIGKPVKTADGYTPMLTDSRAPSLYFVDLIGIIVSGKKLEISPSVFKTVGTIIDSGTVITRLPPAAYLALRKAFRAGMTKYPRAPAISELDTCYDFRKYPKVKTPVIELQYSGFNYTVPATGVFYVFNSSQVCLGFAGNPYPTQIGIIGNVLQRTAEVTHDNVRKRIGFSAGACS